MTSIANYIKTLVNMPSPTGYTKKITDYLLKNAEDKKIKARKTRKGAVIYRFDGGKREETVMFAAHIDTLGAMVSRIKDNHIYFSPLGGSPAAYVIGNYCTIHTTSAKNGNAAVKGTILPENPAVHVNQSIKTDYKPEISNLCIRPDVDCNKNQLEDWVKVGDFISFDPNYEKIDGFIKSRHLDDKASCAVLLALADQLSQNKIDLEKNVELFFNITEETGQGMSGYSNRIDDLVIVDMGVVGDGCNGDEFHVSICAKDTSGPYHHELTQALVKTAEANKIGYKMDVFPFYSSDGSMVLRSGGDMRVALIGPGVSASHGYERTHIQALKQTFELIKAFIAGP